MPVVNGNGLLDRGKIARLRSLREAPKEVDVAYVSNVWGGREHSLRVFGRLAELDCSKDLLAIFPEGFPPEEDAENMERLRARGIPVTRAPVPPRELWRRLARARLVPMRAGKHLCFLRRSSRQAQDGPRMNVPDRTAPRRAPVRAWRAVREAIGRPPAGAYKDLYRVGELVTLDARPFLGSDSSTYRATAAGAAQSSK